MNTQLIKLKDCNIITTDEQINNGDWFIDLERESYRKPYLCDIGSVNHFVLTKEINFPIEGCRKIIASDDPKYMLPSIDYNNFEFRLGIVTMDALFQKDLNAWLYKNDNHWTYYEGKSKTSDFKDLWESGFKTAQRFFNTEDMKECLQQPNVFDIEVEVELYDINHFKPALSVNWQPKIIDNSIKITKIL
jgi:hypothetical protein